MKKKTLAVLLSATLVTSSITTVFAKDITVTIPNYASDEGNSNLPEAVETVTNSDGSISYTLDKKQQKKWKKDLKSSFDDSIKEILDDDENYPNVEDITYNDDMNNTSSSETKVDKISLTSDSSSLEYSGFETMPYEDGSSDILGIVKFNFTNKTDSPDSATSFYNIKAYQNSVELTWYMGNGNAACDNTYKTVLKDTSIETGFAFMLQDAESPITVYAYDGFMSDSPCQVQEIAIK